MTKIHQAAHLIKKVNAKLLIVDDENCRSDCQGFYPAGISIVHGHQWSGSMRIFQDEQIDLGILDYSLPDICGADLFRQMRAITPDFPIVFFTGYPNLATAVELRCV